MEVIVLVIHLFLALALIGVVLIQRSDGSALGGLGGGSSGSLLSARGAGNVLTRTTAIIGAAFIVTSITLTILARVTQPETIVPVEPVSAPPSDPFIPMGGESAPPVTPPVDAAPETPPPATPETAPDSAAEPAPAPAEPPPATP
ncbi:MAG TPA: preprotein translocase subunit SecG [Micropepsaceae bacterium]|nr:preprotein translocase subunit SecG [Micropepsaceae bacterium]